MTSCVSKLVNSFLLLPFSELSMIALPLAVVTRKQ